MERSDIHAGLMRHPITFKNVAKAGNTSAGYGETYSNFYSARAFVNIVSSNRFFNEGVDLMVVIAEAYCYWRHVLEANLTKDTRVLYEGDEYRIENFQLMNGERNMYKFDLSKAE